MSAGTFGTAISRRGALRRLLLAAALAAFTAAVAPGAAQALSFSPAPGSPFATGARGPESLAVGNFNGDSNSDLAIAHFNDPVAVLLGSAGGSFAQAPGSPFGPAQQNDPSVVVGNFNGEDDSYPDLAVLADGLCCGSENLTILLGSASGSFAEAPGSPYLAGGFATAIAVGNFNADADPDLAVAHGSNGGELSVLLGGPGASFANASVSPFASLSNPWSMAVGNFNADADPDLAVANSITSTDDDVTVLLGGTGASFTEASGSPFAAGELSRSVAVGDFDADARHDLAVANEGSDDLTVLLGGAGGSFSPAPGSPFASGESPSSVALGNFDSDSDPDLAIGHYVGDVVVLLGGANASFTAAPGSPFDAGERQVHPQSVAVGRFNAADTRDDLAVANYGSDVVSVLLQSPNNPPSCLPSQVTVSPAELTQPQTTHTLHLVTLSGGSDPDGDPVALRITAVRQDEPLTSSDRNDASPDAFSADTSLGGDPFASSLLDNDPNQVWLRAERSNSGDGRAYRIFYTGSDGQGGTCPGGVERVFVRRSATTAAIDSIPPSYNSFGP